MATAVPVGNLLREHSTNTVQITNMQSQSSKSWASEFPVITKLRVHTHVMDDGAVVADFDTALLPLLGDDHLRLAELASPPNVRHHRLYSEEDGVTWFHSEISNIVLPAFRAFPQLIQTSHRPSVHGSGSNSKIADVAYTANLESRNTNVAVGEFKRNLIFFRDWQNGLLTGPQRQFSQELRGYAHLYDCPHMFCFDHEFFLMLQFRASAEGDIRQDGDVDCWILPRVNPNGTSIREALYRLLVQGLRRFQGQHRVPALLNGSAAERTELFSGLPLWTVNGTLTANPYGYSRVLDPQTGAFFWVDEYGNRLVDGNGNIMWDTVKLWG